MLNCKASAIFASGQACRGKPPVAAAVVHFLRTRRIAARLPHSSIFSGLPVVDADGRFKGMARRDSMRQTVFGGSS
jgi:hypothetical protein